MHLSQFCNYRVDRRKPGYTLVLPIWSPTGSWWSRNLACIRPAELHGLPYRRTGIWILRPCSLTSLWHWLKWPRAPSVRVSSSPASSDRRIFEEYSRYRSCCLPSRWKANAACMGCKDNQPIEGSHQQPSRKRTPDTHHHSYTRQCRTINTVLKDQYPVFWSYSWPGEIPHMPQWQMSSTPHNHPGLWWKLWCQLVASPNSKGSHLFAGKVC